MPAAKTIVVISDRQDAHIPYVQRHLSQEMVVLDPQTLLECHELTYATEGNRVVVIYGEQRLESVKSVWYRKPREIMPAQLHVAEEFLNYATNSLQTHTSMLTSAFRDSFWVSEYAAMRRASSKAWQLEVAAQLGFNIPKTIMTSNPDTARRFVASQKECIVKPISIFPATQERPKAFFATRISPRKLPDLTNLYLAPAIFQQCIDVAFDVRVTVVGHKTFPAIIRHTNEQDSNIRDWRLGHQDGNLQIEAYEHFPADIADLCVAHTHKLGLVYGAIDLVMDKKGSLWFLENNPGGQWGFVERLSGLPIGKAVAEMLETGSSRPTPKTVNPKSRYVIQAKR